MNNNTRLKVSVLMLTYNQERYINEAIRSVGELANKQMGAITGGLNIPGMPF